VDRIHLCISLSFLQTFYNAPWNTASNREMKPKSINFSISRTQISVMHYAINLDMGKVASCYLELSFGQLMCLLLPQKRKE
jgi:hypothetical protein